ASRTAVSLGRTNKNLSSVYPSARRSSGATCADRSGSEQHSERGGRMRRLTHVALALCAALVAAGPPAAARGAPALEVGARGVGPVEWPALAGPWTAAGPLPQPGAVESARPVAVTAGPDRVKATVRRAFRDGRIDAPARDRYLGGWSSALNT